MPLLHCFTKLLHANLQVRAYEAARSRILCFISFCTPSDLLFRDCFMLHLPPSVVGSRLGEAAPSEVVVAGAVKHS